MQTHTKWNDPLVGFADANDSLFIKLKEVVSNTHLLPRNILNNANSVISYFIPFKKETILTNTTGKHSSKEWAIAYIETNKLIEAINRYLSQKLEGSVFETSIIPATHNFNKKLLISDWSHKHIAYIAGLGNFGLHRMLITDKGCCGRFGSLVTSLELKPTKKREKSFCLYFHNKSCTMCVQYCIFNALKIGSFNRNVCYQICILNQEKYKDLGNADVCGKCISIVPCSMKNPVEA